MYLKFVTDVEDKAFTIVKVQDVVSYQEVIRSVLEEVDNAGEIVMQCASEDAHVFFRDRRFDADYPKNSICRRVRLNGDKLLQFHISINEDNQNVYWITELPVFILDESGRTIEKVDSHCF